MGSDQSAEGGPIACRRLGGDGLLGVAVDGYKAHFTETCDTGAPHLIVRAAATPASSDDATQTAAIHDDLHKQGLHPSEHFADTGYSSAKLIVRARTAGIDLVAPVMLSTGARRARTTDTPPMISPSIGTPGR